MSKSKTTAETLLLLNEAISLGRRDGMAGQHLGAMCSARDEINGMRLTIGALQKENRELKSALREIKSLAHLMIGAESHG